jgi:phosphate-selective porin OprO and OprP
MTFVDSFARYGLEAAGNYGPLSLQGEYFLTEVERDGLNADADFDGYYVFGTWVITGESRTYKFEDGNFENPKPKSTVGMGGIGAWEVLARYSAVDLKDTALATTSCRVTPGAAVVCGEQEDVTLGLNWYPTTNFKFMLNYVHVLDIEGGRFDGASPDIFQARAQAYW